MTQQWTITSAFKFTREYFDIGWVYSQIPEIYDGLSWYVPYGPRASRTVCIKGDHRASRVDRFYELWSPNANYHEFYPGSPLDNDHIIAASHQSDFAFPDGRLGPYDWSLHPQHFSLSAPWLGFCRRPPTGVSHWKDVLPELVPLPLVFLHSNSYPGKGKLDSEFARRFFDRAQFLGTSVSQYNHIVRDSSQQGDEVHLKHVLDSRPRYPSRANMETLANEDQYWTWEQLLVVFTSAQRGLREMEAWLTMMEYWPSRGRSHCYSLHVVNDDRIGVWLNTADQFNGHWLLNTGVVPVYIIHRFVQDVEFPKWRSVLDRRQASSTWLYNFVQGTPAETLNSNSNLYIQVFDLFGNKKIRNFHKHMLKSGRDPQCEDVDRQRSSSWAANSDPSVGLGYDTETGYDDPHFVRDSSNCKQVNSRLKAEMQQMWGSGDAAFIKQTSQRLDVEVDSPPPVCPRISRGELVVERSISFWKPPPVFYGPRSRIVGQTKRGGKRKTKTTWLLFVEVDYEMEFGYGPPKGYGETIMVAKSKLPEDFDDDDLSVPLEQRTYFDRHQGRRLVFQSPLNPPDHVFYNVSVFGFPLLKRIFCTAENHKPTMLPSSDWIYNTPHPSDQHEVGSLPLLAECRPAIRTFVPPLHVPARDSSLARSFSLALNSTKENATGLMGSKGQRYVCLAATDKRDQDTPLKISLINRCNGQLLALSDDTRADHMDNSMDTEKVNPTITDDDCPSSPVPAPTSAVTIDRFADQRSRLDKAMLVDPADLHPVKAGQITQLLDCEDHHQVDPRVASRSNDGTDGEVPFAAKRRTSSVDNLASSDIKDESGLAKPSDNIFAASIRAPGLEVGEIFLQAPAYRTFCDDPPLLASAFAYISCAIPSSSLLKDHLCAICEHHNSRTGVLSIHRDTLNLPDNPHPSFVLAFDSAVQAVTVRRFLSEVPAASTFHSHVWIFISDLRAGIIVSDATDVWLSPPSWRPALPNTLNYLDVSRPPSSSFAHSSSSAPAGSTLATPLEVGFHDPPYAYDQRYHPSLPMAIARPHPYLMMIPRPGFSRCYDWVGVAHIKSTYPAPRKRSRSQGSKRGSGLNYQAKTRRAGCRAALTSRFSKPFWDIVGSITDEELSTCTPAQQEFVRRKKEEEAAGIKDKPEDDEEAADPATSYIIS